MDKNRILSKLKELDEYLEELDKIKPDDFEVYESPIENKRACERLLQISIETVVDICNLIVSELKLGILSNEDEVFKKMEINKIISKKLLLILKEMKGFRNILIHKYGTVDNEIVFEMLNEKLRDLISLKMR